VTRTRPQYDIASLLASVRQVREIRNEPMATVCPAHLHETRWLLRLRALSRQYVVSRPAPDARPSYQRAPTIRPTAGEPATRRCDAISRSTSPPAPAASVLCAQQNYEAAGYAALIEVNPAPQSASACQAVDAGNRAGAGHARAPRRGVVAAPAT
jgi:hypothetical protein